VQKLSNLLSVISCWCFKGVHNVIVVPLQLFAKLWILIKLRIQGVDADADADTEEKGLEWIYLMDSSQTVNHDHL